MKIIHITDIHTVDAGQILCRLELRARLDAAISDINENQTATGVADVADDQTHFGDQEA
jgi:hypothetical protein